MTRRLLALLCLAACGPTPEEILAKHRPAVEATFAKIRSLDPLVKAIPPLTSAPPAGAADPAYKIPNSVFFIRDGEIPTPEERFVSGQSHSSDYLTPCGDILKDGVSGRNAEAIETYMASCAAWRYALVIRERDHRSPQLVGDGKFAPGFYRAEILAFSLEGTPKYLGGYAWEATNNDEVSSYGSVIDDARLEKNLEAVIDSKRIEASIRALPALLK